MADEEIKKEEPDSKSYKTTGRVPLLALRDLVIFPSMVIPLFVGREKSIKALEAAMERDRMILLVAQKDARTDNPSKNEIYNTGTFSEILQILKLPDGAIRVLVEGVTRVRIKEYVQDEPFFEVTMEEVAEEQVKDKETEAMMRLVMDEFQKHVKMNKKIPPETIMSVSEIENPGKLSDVIAANIFLKHEEKQALLEMEAPKKRLNKMSEILQRENEILEIERKIQVKVKSSLEKSQKEYYLSEQLKAIQKELGKGDSSYNELEEIKEKIKKAKMPKEGEEKALKELSRLEKMMPMSAEATVIRTYLDWLIALPWNTKTKDKLDLKHVQDVLDEDHYGLEKPKERILEYLAVKKNMKDKKEKAQDPIICFVGPPGVGKTSLAKSIARAMDRSFVRLSLGGIRDEAEIRGHRRTYIGAMPGRIIQSIRKAKSKNPVFLMDEVDKMSSDFRGDPAAALLEVLDPEQNNTFMDHYLDSEFDLSDVMFITTANTLYGIPLPLQDRMEIIEINSYTEHEKASIVKKFLIPKQLKLHGLTVDDVLVKDDAVNAVINGYTREAGVRNMEREVKALFRKVAKEKVTDEKKFKKITIDASNIEKFLGVPKFQDISMKDVNDVGAATGMAWTEVGGDVLVIEVSIMKGKGQLMLTGKLGDVMKESAQAALSYARAKAKKLGIKEDVFAKNDIHVHVPEGAIPKDGPSAGITIATAIISAFTGKPVKKLLSMTGEITLRGRVLPIGGLKEKTLAAARNGIKEVIIPFYNKKDFTELPDYVKENMKFHFAKTMDEVIKIALGITMGGKKKEMKYVFKKKKLTLLVGTADIAGSIVFWPVMIIRKLLNAGKIPKNILVVRLDQTGDCIQAIPFLKSLRFKHPNARISLLVLKNNEFLFISNPAVNSVLTVDSSWFTKTGPDFIKKFFNITSVIKAGGFDMAFDLRGDLRTIAALFFGGVKKISGYGCAGGGFLLDETREYDRELHEMDKNLRLLDEKEISGPVAIDFSQPGEKKAVEFIKTVNADKSIRIIVHPFAGASSKLWGMEKYRLLVEKIFEYNGKAVVFITGGPADAGQWQFFNGTGAINAIAMPIDVSMALIGKCSIFIGSDSFAQYTAAYSGLNTCVISGYTSNYERWKPKIESKKLRIFHKPVECGPCELAVCNQSSHKCMDIITVDEVFESIKNWLK